MELTIPYIFLALKDFAKSLRIKKAKNISSGSEVDKGFYFIKNFEFSGQATYLQFLILLGADTKF